MKTLALIASFLLIAGCMDSSEDDVMWEDEYCGWVVDHKCEALSFIDIQNENLHQRLFKNVTELTLNRYQVGDTICKPHKR